MRNGWGIFFIIGSVRFGELVKICFLYLLDWENIVNIVFCEGRMECLLVLWCGYMDFIYILCYNDFR